MTDCGDHLSEFLDGLKVCPKGHRAIRVIYPNGSHEDLSLNDALLMDIRKTLKKIEANTRQRFRIGPQ